MMASISQKSDQALIILIKLAKFLGLKENWQILTVFMNHLTSSPY
jgi:hypothetical protein